MGETWLSAGFGWLKGPALGSSRSAGVGAGVVVGIALTAGLGAGVIGGASTGLGAGVGKFEGAGIGVVVAMGAGVSSARVSAWRGTGDMKSLGRATGVVVGPGIGALVTRSRAGDWTAAGVGACIESNVKEAHAGSAPSTACVSITHKDDASSDASRMR